MNPEQILLLPGWLNSTEGHWQTEWERAHGYRRVEQHDWFTPRRGDWSARLEEVIIDTPAPVLLVAHSLGCILTAWWAAHSRSAHRVRGALLVAPGDVEQVELSAQIPGWAPIVRQPLPFPAVLVGSRNDPYCSFQRAQGLASDWGARFVDLGERGHVNAESGLGLWPEGHAWLESLMRDTDKD
ncbi:RBBP9/YdeN family alpha/beta hydrolase [Melaminivora alkalimesophila]|uniref:Alpha/beta hydrolase n=1 Tax=Melaminivora alkalimesophila TaxID=1165852 RepID=A0A317RER2_9BURK|nr:alpha/beta fold hydrolase [Melaminivora alkalimesophila]PWW46946.1 hypothetical protein DFR36_103221 [Melaminivora alkalimesophila]